MYTTTELSRRTGVPASTIKRWMTAGYLRPAVTALGKGDVTLFGEDSETQIRALAMLTQQFGDGALVREIIAEAIPKIRQTTRALNVSAVFSLA